MAAVGAGDLDTAHGRAGLRRGAELVPGARLMLVDDMGHDMPVELLPELCAALLAHPVDDRSRPEPTPAGAQP
jgi:hypothetical protein